MLEPAQLLGRRCVSADLIELELWVPATLSYFPDHFPAQPILPGVVQLGWAVTQAQREFAPTAALRRLFGLKFMHPILPERRLQLSLQRKSADQIGFTYRSGEQVLSSGRLDFC